LFIKHLSEQGCSFSFRQAARQGEVFDDLPQSFNAPRDSRISPVRSATIRHSIRAFVPRDASQNIHFCRKLPKIAEKKAMDFVGLFRSVPAANESVASLHSAEAI
jgi:hypothetical protein